MSLLASVPPDCGHQTILQVAQLLASEVARLPRPRSLCELRLDHKDYEWLCSWAHKLSSSTARAWLTGVGVRPDGTAPIRLRGREAIGALLLLLAAEIARREAREGYLWSPVQARFSSSTRALLFNGGQPTPIHKEALEAAARQLGLRHVFGVEGTQNYYVTIYLQFGFTRRGMARLPYWLAGQAPSEAIQALTDKESWLFSDSFDRLWDALRQYRRNNWTERRTRAILHGNPWILPEWVDELLQRAREKLELDKAKVASGGREGQPAFLDRPHLRWSPPDTPRFMCRLTNLAAFDLSAKHYSLMDGEKILASLLRQSDESYLLPECIALPDTCGQHAINLIDDQGAVVSVQSVDLWDVAEDITVYDLGTGNRIDDPWQQPLSPQRSYALITTYDLEIDPEPVHWRLLGDRTRRLSLLPAGWPTSLRVLLEGEVLWTPHVGKGSRPIPPEPAWAKSIVVIAGKGIYTVHLGSKVQPVIDGLPEDARMTFVRLNGRPCNFVQTECTAVLDQFEISPAREGSNLELRVGVQRAGEHVQLRRQLALRVIGAARFTDQGWVALSPDKELTVEEASRSTFRLFLPASEATSEPAKPALFEGFSYSRRVSHSTGPFGRLAGYGAELRVQPNPYNTSDVLLSIARAVIHPGVVSGVEIEESGVLRIRLTGALEPGPGHQILIWPVGGTLHLVAVREIAVMRDQVWEIGACGQPPGALLLGIAYEGARIGSWWPADLGTCWKAPTPHDLDPACAAALVRWLHLPLLDVAYLKAFQAFARAYPAPTLQAWVLDKGLPNGLLLEPAGEEWHEVVRSVFWGWYPSPVEARTVIDALTASTPDERLRALAEALRFDPLLLERLVKAWPADMPPSSEQPALQDAVRAVRCELAGLAADASDGELAQREKELVEEVASVMQVDPYFIVRGIVERVCSGRLNAIDEHNLRVALGMMPFRQYLTLRLLSRLS